MNPSYLSILAYILLPILSSIGAYVVRDIINRISVLETKIENKVTDTYVRQIMNDNIQPIREDMDEIKQKLDKLFDLIYSQKGE